MSMLPGRSDLASAGDAAWLEQLAELPHDIFHRPDYHSLSGFGHQGTAHLFSYREQGAGMFVWPYLKRPIPGSDDFDVTSVYGYSGPLASGDADFLDRAWTALANHWRDLRVVCAFTRFHPVIGNARQSLAVRHTGGLRATGCTVSIDLSLPPEDQVRGYQKVLRQEIRKAREAGFTTVEDEEFRHVGDFVRLYGETMSRRNSRAEYRVDVNWVRDFKTTLGNHARLFITRFEGEVAAALLAIEYEPFLHAHLTGINAELTAHSPLKILLDDIRTWGTERGLKAFHLGGGLGGREDSLYQFKRRFSPVSHEFHVGSWIFDTHRYQELARDHEARLVAQGYPAPPAEFFPVYRFQPAPVAAS